MEEKDRTQETDKGLSPDQRQDRMGQGTTVYDGLVKKFHFIRQERDSAFCLMSSLRLIP